MFGYNIYCSFCVFFFWFFNSFSSSDKRCGEYNLDIISLYFKEMSNNDIFDDFIGECRSVYECEENEGHFAATVSDARQRVSLKLLPLGGSSNIMVQ